MMNCIMEYGMAQYTVQYCKIWYGAVVNTMAINRLYLVLYNIAMDRAVFYDVMAQFCKIWHMIVL